MRPLGKGKFTPITIAAKPPNSSLSRRRPGMHTPKRSSVFAVFRIGFPSFSLDGECGSERCVLGPSLIVVERKVPFNTRGAEVPLHPCVFFAFVGLSN